MKLLTIKTPSGETWGVPVDLIARNRAECYAHEFDGSVEQSLAEDTAPLFESDEYEIRDWAANNMNWADVAIHAVRVSAPEPADMQEAWINGEKDVIDVADTPPAAPCCGGVCEGHSIEDGNEHPHDASFLGVALLVAIGQLETPEITLTAENIEAAMHFGLISEPSENGETVRIYRSSRAEAEAMISAEATISAAADCGGAQHAG